MYIIRIFAREEVLTYTFQNESSGRWGNDGVGVTSILGAFKKYYENDKDPASARVMNENGLFYDPSINKYVYTADFKGITIPLNEAAKHELGR